MAVNVRRREGEGEAGEAATARAGHMDVDEVTEMLAECVWRLRIDAESCLNVVGTLGYASRACARAEGHS
jgi:hypothetical protein